MKLGETVWRLVFVGTTLIQTLTPYPDPDP